MLQIVGAIYDAVAALGLTYTSPPASFESNGQKVRTPDRIADSKMAACLDLSLLFAACIEQAGLHPLVLLVKGHAFVGVWLVEDSFPETATTEPFRIIKRVELDAIRVFETTGVASRPQLPFEASLDAGRRRLEAVDQFLFSVDVHSARRARIRPLPMRGAPGAVAVVTEIRAVAEPAAVYELQPAHPASDSGASDGESSTPRGRLARWKRKLLDLTLRNRLLNHRDTKQCVPLLLPDLARVEDALAGNRALELCERPQILRGGDPRDPDVHRSQTGEDGIRKFVADELRAQRLHTTLEADDLGDRLLEISRTARLALEEGGANTLYLALGFLAWYETPSSADARIAPILLVPVTLERRTALDAFRLRLLDDDVRLNVTLLQKLKNEYGVEVRGLDPLPEDDSGVDVKAVLRAFRESVLQLPRWHVREHAVVGIFSFTKYLMWLDLETRHEVLARNEIVRHLIAGGTGTFPSEGTFPDERTLDDDRDPAATFCPLDADSSQLSAVHAAADGKTFVLQGPPGTGKSQTITNLIVHCLATGKRVLFVSEKVAALDVVHRRLTKVGVAPFCLALHSNKAQKKEVLDRIGEALDYGARATPGDWQTLAAELQTVRTELNRYCRALHAPRHFGITAYQAITTQIGLVDAHETGLDLGEPRQLPSDLPARVRAVVAALAAEAVEADGVAGHPLACVHLDRWQPQTDEDARRVAAELVSAAECLRAAVLPVASAMGLAERPWSAAELERFAEWCALLGAAPTADIRELVCARDWAQARGEAEQAIAAGRDRDARRIRLFARYREDILDAPLDAWLGVLRTAQSKWAPLRWWTGRGPRTAMDAFRAVAGATSDVERIGDLQECIALRTVTRGLTAPGSVGARLFGSSWRSSEANWDELGASVTWAGRFRDLLSLVAGGSLDERTRLRDTWLRLVSEGRDLFLRDGELTPDFAGCGTALRRYVDARRAFLDGLRADDAAAFGGGAADGALPRAVATAQAVSSNIARLRSWCGYQRARGEALALRLDPIVSALESGSVSAGGLGACSERSFHAWWLRVALASEPILAEFSSTRITLAIERFRKREQEVLQATVGVVQARLAAALPRTDPSLASKGEIGTIRREIQKKTRHVPLRKLFEQVPNALSRLKPCMLMSPLSVAQYLSPDFPAFDLVVFDEASQIPVWDAIGAIARGKELVVVGDSKQLPPTSFFEKEDSEEELDEDDVEDLESILDECVAAGLPPRTLDWHYRSKHESLIAFSNRHYYQDRLFTFPSAEATVDRIGVSLRPVPDGVYDKGHTRANRREAEELVADLVRRLRDPIERGRSFGIVTFSMAQQLLVENLLEAARRKHPEIEPYFGSDAREPVFVKNLENVQGDERDVILFSICYGPDAQRRVYMNFGPLNRTGGERRLNVAITRAREQVVVFSTLRADQIDLARTRALGVQHLKAYLEYAEHGASALADGGAGPTGADWDSPFEQAVERALVDRGWTVHRQIGCSGYRIDLAVVDPDRPGRYVLGIECDGASYHSGRTARDRDRLREAVLRTLGWRLHRVWSTDWWYDPAREVARIEEAIRKAKAAVPDATAPPPSGEPVATAAPDVLRIASLAAPLASASGAVSDAGDVDFYPEPLESPLHGTPERFARPYADDEIVRTIRAVVDREAPIAFGLMSQRVAALWGRPRLVARTIERLSALTQRAGVRVTDRHGEAVCWRAGDDPAAFSRFRRQRSTEAPARTVDQVPLEELALAVVYVLEAHLSAPVEDVAREAARFFGSGRLTAVVRPRMERAIEIAAASGRCRVADGRVTLSR